MLKIRNRKIPKIKTVKLANSQNRKGPDLYFVTMSMDVTTLFVKQAYPKKLPNPSISIHALWLIYFRKPFFSPFIFTNLLAITKTKKAKIRKHNKI